MKKDISMPLSGEPFEFVSNRAGTTALLAIVLLVAARLCLHGNHAQSSVTSPLFPVDSSVGLSGFRADAWYLPDDPLWGFVEIPGGPFTMGSDPEVDTQAFGSERWSADRYQGTVELPVFYIGRYEVTIAQFKAFVEATGYRVDKQSLSGAANHPVANVSWTDALAYSRWLGQSLMSSPQTPPRLAKLLREGWRTDLPTEAEWEKAARGTDRRIYPWGNMPRRELANFRGSDTAPVGSIDCVECAFHLADMSGNVWELTRSSYRPYPFDPNSDMADLHSDALFVMRGGSFKDDANNVRAAVRGGVDPGVRRPFVGFRVTLSRP